MKSHELCSVGRVFVLIGLLSCVSQVAVGLDKRKDLSGIVFRVPGFNIPPFCVPVMEGTNVTYKGIMMDIVEWLAESCKFKIDYVKVDESIASHDAKVVVETIRMLAADEIDLISMPLPPKWQLLRYLDYTLPLHIEDYYLLQKRPQEESRLLALIKPFSLTVWLFFVVSTVAMILVMTVFTLLYQRWKWLPWKSSIGVHLSRHFDYVFTIISYQGNCVPYDFRASFSVLVGVWCLLMVVLGNAYTGNLMSCLVTPTYEPVANTLEEAAAMDIQVSVMAGSPLSASLLTAVGGSNKVLGEKLRSNKRLIVSDYESAAANVLQLDHCAYAGVDDHIRVMIVESYMKERQCLFALSKALAYTEIYSLGLPKSSPYSQIMDQAVLRMLQAGLINQWRKIYFPIVDECKWDSTNPPRTETHPLKWIYLSSAFVLYGIIACIATLVFLIEMLIHTESRRNRLAPYLQHLMNMSTMH